MKIALISHLYPTKLYPHHGKFIQDQFELLNEHSGVEVDLIVPTPYSIPFTQRWEKNHSNLICDNNKSIRISYLSFPKKQNPKLVQRSISKRIIDHLKQKKYDLVHVHWLFPDGLILPTLKSVGYKSLITVHGGDWYQNTDNTILSELAKSSLKAADRVLYSGPLLQNDVELVYPELETKSALIYNMVDTESYIPIVEKDSLRKEFGWNHSKIHSLTVANIRPEKGIDLLIDTISKNESLKDIQFHLVGNPEATQYSDEILTSIEENPFQNIDLIPAVSPKELIKYYQASDFYILPSRREGFNVSILEAASCGLPLLCTDVGGNKKVIELGLGLLNKKLESLSASLIFEMAESFQKYNPEFLHQTIDQYFGKDAFLERLVANYKKVLV